MKLLTTSETENAGISGELRCLVRVRCEFGVCGRSSREGRGTGDDALLFARERVRGFGLCASADTGRGSGGGGELQTIEENEERDEREQKKCVDVGSEDCGDDEMLGSLGCEIVLGPCGVAGVPHVMDGRPSALGHTALVGGCGSVE